jgi:ABC-type polysaccharide/polyol phosphate export permease
VQVAFFLTPVIWKPQMLGRNQWAADWNPFYHFLEVVRGPLITGTMNASSWSAVLCITAVGYAVTFSLFARYRARIAYWI